MKIAKSTVLILSSALCGLSLSASVAAQTNTAQELRIQERRAARVEARRQERVDARVAERAASVPELDASGAPIALALVGGLAGIALERRRRKKSA